MGNSVPGRAANRSSKTAFSDTVWARLARMLGTTIMVAAMDDTDDSRIPSQPPCAAPPVMVDGLVNPSHVGDVLLALRRSDLERAQGLSRARISTWAATVVIACLALGFLGSMVQSLSRELGREQNLANGSKSVAEYAQSLNEDVGKLLADPRTQLVRLSSPSLLAADASIAWNGARHDGALFCDKLPLLPSSQAYEIWAIGRADQGAKMVEVRPAPGVSVYPFHYSDAVERLSRFEVTAGSRDAAKPPVFAGTIQ
jgi:hypothetical protein